MLFHSHVTWHGFIFHNQVTFKIRIMDQIQFKLWYGQ